jgi:hypothetical protein
MSRSPLRVLPFATFSTFLRQTTIDWRDKRAVLAMRRSILESLRDLKSKEVLCLARRPLPPYCGWLAQQTVDISMRSQCRISLHRQCGAQTTDRSDVTDDYTRILLDERLHKDSVSRMKGILDLGIVHNPRLASEQ